MKSRQNLNNAYDIKEMTSLFLQQLAKIRDFRQKIKFWTKTALFCRERSDKYCQTFLIG